MGRSRGEYPVSDVHLVYIEITKRERGQRVAQRRRRERSEGAGSSLPSPFQSDTPNYVW